MWSGFRRYHKEWGAFVDFLKTGERPVTFRKAWEIVGTHVCGMYDREAEALWESLQTQEVHSLCEIGRCLGGGLFLLVCACPAVKHARSVDIVGYPEIDEPLAAWMNKNDIESSLEISDSALVTADKMFDFVWVDGGHTGPAVSADIEIWRRNARLIGFHDYADKGRSNKHVRDYHDVTAAITTAAAANSWRPVGRRGCSDIIFTTPNAVWRCADCRELFSPTGAASERAERLCPACSARAEGLG